MVGRKLGPLIFGSSDLGLVVVVMCSWGSDTSVFMVIANGVHHHSHGVAA